MKATAKINELTSDNCKYTIIRNLNRILDIRILDIDLEHRTISFLYDSALALEKVKRELSSIGFPVLQCKLQEPVKEHRDVSHSERLVTH